MLSPEAEKLFQIFLNKEDREKSAKILGDLLENHIRPFIKPILVKALQNGNYSYSRIETEVEEVSSQIVTYFFERFKKYGKAPFYEIKNLEAYFTIVAKRRAQDFWRKQNQPWVLLKHKIKFLFEKNNDFVCFKETRLFALKGKGVFPSGISQKDLVALIKEKGLITAQTDLDEAVKIVLTEANGGLFLEDLVKTICELQNIEADMPEIPLEDKIHSIASNALGDNSQARLESIAELKKIWSEIKNLNFNQRTALLLNMQENSVSGVHLLLFLRIANLNEMAETLGMSLEKFAELYQKLPLKDNKIAEILGVTAKQAGALRKVARERLQRKLRDF